MAMIASEGGLPTMMSDSKAALFDVGGVLIEDPGPAMVKHFAQRLNVEPKDIQTAMRRCVRSFQQGLISEPEFWRNICRSVNITGLIPQTLWGEGFRTACVVRESMVQFVKEVKGRGYRIGVLSNTELPVAAYLRNIGLFKSFDVVVLSCEVGLVKPDQKIYERAAECLGVALPEAVLIDDRGAFVHAARQAGMRGIVFTSPEQTQKEFYGIMV
jgi:epoxide hydrolase-like predicted phosphatase